MATTLSDAMVQSNTTMEEKAPKGNNDQKKAGNKQDQDRHHHQHHQQAASTTPRSSSSTNLTTSSGKATTGANQGSTHTMGKFKEKRPEPLNLNPNLNQEIPLDLSVKSAGNMPSGRSVNTLETPRIFWLDNEALLIKPRLYSSSTSASQRVRLSSLAGDSPPITPNTPFMDLVCSPVARSAIDHHPNSASMLLDSNSSLHSLMSAHYQYSKQQRHQFDDHLLSATTPNTTNKLTPTNRFLVHHHFKQGNNELIRTPRRSCSTDNLSSLTNCNGHLSTFKALQSYRSQQQQSNQRLSLQQQHQQQQHNPTVDNKKNSISPLVKKNLSSFKSGCNRFSYSGHQIANCNGTATTTTSFNNDNVNGSSATSVTGDQSQSSTDNRPPAGDGSGKALTPTSLANATANLLNIHLNSPTNSQQQQGPTLMEGLTSTLGSISSINDLLATQKSPTDQNMDPLISAAYCQHHQQQQQQILRSSLTSSTSSSTFGGVENQVDKLQNNLTPIYCGQQGNLSSVSLLGTNNGLSSLSSSATLNTPTLVSPSQLKSGSSICFLPSPLSPMSSVFELPSPLLMFPPPPTSTTNQNSHLSQLGSGGGDQTLRNNKASTPENKAPTATTEVQQHQQQEAIGPSGHIYRDNTDKSKSGDAQYAPESTVSTATADSNRAESNLSLLVTSARDKLDVVDVDDEVSLDNMRMEIDTQDMISNSADLPSKEGNMISLQDNLHNIQARPATVIPRILVSDSCRLQQQQQQQQQPTNIHYQQRENQRPPTYQNDNIQQQQQQQSESMVGDVNNLAQTQNRAQRDVVGKRALSPQSFKARVSVYHNERHESSSAPPDVYQSRARSKIKSAAEPCIVHGQPDEQQQQHQQQHQSDLCIRPPPYQLNPSPTQANYYNHQHYKTNAPYPELQSHCGWTHVGQAQHHQGLPIKTGRLRPSSAEPSSSQYSSGQHLVESPQHQGFDVASMSAHQYHHHPASAHHLHQPQPHQISPMSNIFSSHSEQHLRSSDIRLDAKGSAPEQIVQQQYHSASVGELNRYQMNACAGIGLGGPFVSSTPNQHQPQLTSGAFQQQQQQQQHYQQQPSHIPLARHSANLLAGTHNTNNNNLSQTPMTAKIDSMIEQAPIPIRIVPSLSSNQLAQGHHHQEARYHECDLMESPCQQQQQQHHHHQQQQQEPRALSAEVRGISRSESSCSSVDFGSFRSSSATTAKKYQCDQCAKAFTRSDMLTRHKRLHSGDRPFQCNECKQEFSRSDHLSTHMRTHTGEKPYKCKLCSYSACRKDMITRHMKVHNRSSPNVQQMERGS